MKKALVILLSIIPICMFAQSIHKDCGPEQYLHTRNNIEDGRLNNLPYSAVLHINIRGWGTATFINDYTLITARHVAGKKRVRKIEFYKNIYIDGKVQTQKAELKKGDFIITNIPKDDCPFNFISSDISFISLTSSGMEKLSILYSGHIQLADYKSLQLNPKINVNLTGYPVDQAGSGNNGSDILSTKITNFEDILFDESCTMGGYKLFTCSGDSGAPVWLNYNDKLYIIGIHHGGPEKNTIFNEEERNSFAVITQGVLNFKLP